MRTNINPPKTEYVIILPVDLLPGICSTSGDFGRGVEAAINRPPNIRNIPMTKSAFILKG